MPCKRFLPLAAGSIPGSDSSTQEMVFGSVSDCAMLSLPGMDSIASESDHLHSMLLSLHYLFCPPLAMLQEA